MKHRILFLSSIITLCISAQETQPQWSVSRNVALAAIENLKAQGKLSDLMEVLQKQSSAKMRFAALKAAAEILDDTGAVHLLKLLEQTRFDPDTVLNSEDVYLAREMRAKLSETLSAYLKIPGPEDNSSEAVGSFIEVVKVALTERLSVPSTPAKANPNPRKTGPVSVGEQPPSESPRTSPSAAAPPRKPEATSSPNGGFWQSGMGIIAWLCALLALVWWRISRRTDD